MILIFGIPGPKVTAIVSPSNPGADRSLDPWSFHCPHPGHPHTFLLQLRKPDHVQRSYLPHVIVLDDFPRCTFSLLNESSPYFSPCGAFVSPHRSTKGLSVWTGAKVAVVHQGAMFEYGLPCQFQLPLDAYFGYSCNDTAVVSL